MFSPTPYVNQVIFILCAFRSHLLLVYFIGICILWAANKGKPKGLFFWCHSLCIGWSELESEPLPGAQNAYINLQIISQTEHIHLYSFHHWVLFTCMLRRKWYIGIPIWIFLLKWDWMFPPTPYVNQVIFILCVSFTPLARLFYWYLYPLGCKWGKTQRFIFLMPQQVYA